MAQNINLYCDESCHLRADREPVMVLGTIWLPTEKRVEIFDRMREIKRRHGMHPNAEVKWTKVSNLKFEAYCDLIDYFFDDDDLHFRAVVAHRDGLDHERFEQTHDDWYYKIYYQLITNVLVPVNRYYVYVDIKDTRGGSKTDTLERVLRNGMYDFSAVSLQRIQQVRSHEVEALQLADLLTGAIGYAARQSGTSSPKLALVDRIRERSGFSLAQSTLQRESKFNIFHWKPQSKLDA